MNIYSIKLCAPPHNSLHACRPAKHGMSFVWVKSNDTAKVHLKIGKAIQPYDCLAKIILQHKIYCENRKDHGSMGSLRHQLTVG